MKLPTHLEHINRHEGSRRMKHNDFGQMGMSYSEGMK
jgi:hypothetical protein